jgi:hypothetical protein
MYLGNFKKGQTIVYRFNTRALDQSPITFSGSPSIEVFKNSVTESTDGVTLSVDYDGVTGLNSVTITTASDGTFYDVGNDFDIVIASGTVDGVSVVGTKVATFSLENRFLNQTLSEIGQGSPSASASLVDMIRYLYKSWRNKKTQTASQYSLFADDGTTVDQKATVSDDGTTTTIGEIGTGP